MGQGYSGTKFKNKSTPQDVRDNLEWTLEETGAWEEASRMVYPMLAGHQKELKESAEQIKSPEFDFESCRLTLDDIDNLLMERKKNSGTGIAESSKGPHHHGVDTKGTKESHKTGSGRIPEVRVLSLAFPASTSSNIPPMEEIRNVEVTAPSSDLFRKVAIAEAARRAKHVGKPSVSSISALNPEEEQLRNEIGAKYLYIDQLLYRMQQSAQYCYKLHRRLSDITKRLQSRKVEKLPQIQQLSLHKSHDEISLALENGLSNFDNARNAIAWLYSDYELQIAIFRCRHQLFLAQKARGAQTKPNTTLNTSLDQMIYQLQERYSHLNLEVQQNELYCIIGALSFYDRGQKGYLVPQDVPEMSAHLFSLLDVTNDRCISPEDLQRSILLLNDRLLSNRERINLLTQDNEILHMKERSELNSMRMLENDQKISRLRHEEEEDNKTLKSIFRYFHTGFARFVFNTQESEVPNKTVDSNSLLAEIEAVDMSARIDPLEMNVSDKAKFQRELQRSLWVDRQDELHAASTPIAGETRGPEAEKMARAGLGIESQERERGEIAISQAKAREQEAEQRRKAILQPKAEEESRQEYTQKPLSSYREQEQPKQERVQAREYYVPEQEKTHPTYQKQESYTSAREAPLQKQRDEPMQSVPVLGVVGGEASRKEPYSRTEPAEWEQRQPTVGQFSKEVPSVGSKGGGQYGESQPQEQRMRAAPQPLVSEPSEKATAFREPSLREERREQYTPAVEHKPQERLQTGTVPTGEQAPVTIHQMPEEYGEAADTTARDAQAQRSVPPEQEYESEKPGFFGRLLGIGRKEPEAGVQASTPEPQFSEGTGPSYTSRPQYHPEEAEELVTKEYDRPQKSDTYFKSARGTGTPQVPTQPEEGNIYEKAKSEMEEASKPAEHTGSRANEGPRTIYP